MTSNASLFFLILSILLIVAVFAFALQFLISFYYQRKLATPAKSLWSNDIPKEFPVSDFFTMYKYMNFGFSGAIVKDYEDQVLAKIQYRGERFITFNIGTTEYVIKNTGKLRPYTSAELFRKDSATSSETSIASYASNGFKFAESNFIFNDKQNLKILGGMKRFLKSSYDLILNGKPCGII